MTEKVRLDKELVEMLEAKNRVLEEKIENEGGFIGIRLDEETVQLLERKLRAHKKDMPPIMWMTVAGINEDPTVVVPEKRVDAKSFPKGAVWKEVGKREIEEVEKIVIVRIAGDPKTIVLDPTYRPPDGSECIELDTRITVR